MTGLAAVLLLLGAGAASAGETPEARAAREALEPYARAFELRLIPLSLKKDDDFLSTNYAFTEERDKLYRLRGCFREWKDGSGDCGFGPYLSVARFKAAYDAAAAKDGRVDHRVGARWFCGLIEASRGYFHFYRSTYYGTPVNAVEFTQSVTDAEAQLLKEAYGIDLTRESRYKLSQCEEESVEALKTAGLIEKEPGPDLPVPHPAPEREPDHVYRGVDDLRRLQAEGNRFVWFSGTLWGPWTKDLEALGLLLECRGPRWVGSFAGVLPRDSAFGGGATFTGRHLRHPAQPAAFADIDWEKVRSPARKKACRELSRKLKR